MRTLFLPNHLTNLYLSTKYQKEKTCCEFATRYKTARHLLYMCRNLLLLQRDLHFRVFWSKKHK